MTFYNVDDDFSLDMAWTAALMREHALERSAGWTVNIIDRWFNPNKLKHPTILGSFSWTQAATKTKWIISKHAHSVSGCWQTPGDIARDYLHVKYGKQRRRVSTRQYHEVVKKWRSAPLASIHVHLDDAIYMDLKSAYWQIILLAGWDVDYMPGKWLKKQSHNDDFPYPTIKMARNCLVSMGLQAKMRIWNNGTLKHARRGSSYYNMVLWSFAQDVLNGFAWDMLQAGAVYAHTDGYIIPAYLEEEAYKIADAWGLLLLPKHRGRATVRNVGNYDIGHRNSRLRHVKPRYHMKVYNPGNEWLRPRVKFFSSVNNSGLTHQYDW